MNDAATVHDNLGSQQVRLVHDRIDKQQRSEPRLWIYQYRNGSEMEWNSFYSFPELQFFQEDFEVQNWWACAHALPRWTVLVVRFAKGAVTEEVSSDVSIAGKVIVAATGCIH